MFAILADYDLICGRAQPSKPTVALFGPRRCGKSTLTLALAAQRIGITYVNLEPPTGRVWVMLMGGRAANHGVDFESRLAVAHSEARESLR